MTNDSTVIEPPPIPITLQESVRRFAAWKRWFDIVGSLALLLLLLPVFLGIALGIRFGSPGPILFFHERVGRDGTIFRCWKFRTMVQDAQQLLFHLLQSDTEASRAWSADFKLKQDPRVTRIGYWLRKFSLDELPQIINVLKGDMSFVGPRPIVQDEVSRYRSDIAYYYLVRPGITGLWQVSGRNDTDYATRVALDREYVESHDVWNDLRILIQTIPVVLRRRGAY